MEFEDFYKNFCNQFEESDQENLTPDGEFRDLWSWDSLTGMAVLTMINDKFNVIIPPDEFKNLNTPKEIFESIQKKKTL